MELDPSVLWDFAGEVVGSMRVRRATTTATVTRIDSDGTVWVTTGDGGESPAATASAGVAVGDTVTLAWDGSQMGVASNVSNPSPAGTVITKAVSTAKRIADGAKAIAEATGQHFFADDNGIHVTEAEGDATTAHNILINSLGVLIRHATYYRAAFTDSAVSFFDGLGNAASNIVASFGAVIQLGKADESYALLDYHSLQFVDRDGNDYFHVSDLRGTDGLAEVVDTFVGDGTTSEFELTYTATDTNYTVAVSDSSGGNIYRFAKRILFIGAPTNGATITVSYRTSDANTKAYTLGIRDSDYRVGGMSVAEGGSVVASGFYSHAEGYASKATDAYSHSEGYRSESSGQASHVEGYIATASGFASHAEGSGTTSSGLESHAEGSSTTSSGYASHAEGFATTASGNYSHAQNRGTTAAYEAQTAIGKYNANDPNNAFEIGNGTSNSARSNALTVDWEGNVSDGSGSKLGWTYLGTASTTATSYTLASTHTHLLLTGHNSTAALNGLWIVRPGGNTAFNLAGGGSVTVTVSGTRLTLTTSAGTINAWVYELPSV